MVATGWRGPMSAKAMRLTSTVITCRVQSSFVHPTPLPKGCAVSGSWGEPWSHATRSPGGTSVGI